MVARQNLAIITFLMSYNLSVAMCVNPERYSDISLHDCGQWQGRCSRGKIIIVNFHYINQGNLSFGGRGQRNFNKDFDDIAMGIQGTEFGHARASLEPIWAMRQASRH